MNLKDEIILLKKAIFKVLIEKCNKTKNEAERIIYDFDLDEYIIENPIGLHDSPERWVLVLLTENEDLNSIDYYFSNFNEGIS